MQKCKFFMESMRITQGYGVKSDGSVDYSAYSHVGSYALDLGGNDKATRDWAYAPCDVVVKRVYGDYHAVWFETLEPVLCADGQVRSLVFLLLHINKVDFNELGIKVGKVFRQGERFYREGVAGRATGNHIHFEVGEAPFRPTGWTKSNYRDNAGAYVWVINNQLKPHDIFILGDDVKILSDGGYNWKRESDMSYYFYADVSRYQGKIDWEKVKASCIQGVFLKTVSTNSAFGGIYIDPYFEYNYAECKRLGIPVGAYYYTYAQTKEVADKELAKFKEAVQGKSFELPLVVDVEDNLLTPLSADELTDLVEYALETIQSWKCYAMVYTYLNYSNTELNMDRLSKYDLWLAAYRYDRPSKPEHNIWQFTSSGTVNGIEGNVDLNYAYKNYPHIIAKNGLNDLTNLVNISKWEAVEGMQYEVIAKNCEFFSEADVNYPVGYLPYDTVYEITRKSVVKINGFDWVKIKMVDGEYYAVILSNRCNIIDVIENKQQQIDALKATNKQLEEELAVYRKMYTDIAVKVNDIQEMLKEV